MRDAQHLDLLHRRLKWLACWMIHHANHLRPKGEVNVGGTKPLRPPWRRSCRRPLLERWIGIAGLVRETRSASLRMRLVGESRGAPLGFEPSDIDVLPGEKKGRARRPGPS